MNKPSVGVLNLINSNAPAVHSVVQNLGYQVSLTLNPKEIQSQTHLIIPGVGSFAAVVGEIRALPGLYESIIEFSSSNKPILGICLGMQILGNSSSESYGSRGLGILDYITEPLNDFNSGLPVPHVGWNQVDVIRETQLFEDVPTGSDFYFSHSYTVVQSKDGIATSNYGGEFMSSVSKGKVFGVQFHPERSQHYGKQLIKNFLNV